MARTRKRKGNKLKLIRLSQKHYREEIGDTALEKVFRTLLRELISSHLSGERTIPIKKDSYIRLIEKVPAFCLDSKKMKIVFIEESSQMLLIEEFGVKAQLPTKKKKRKMLNSSTKKRRRIYRRFH